MSSDVGGRGVKPSRADLSLSANSSAEKAQFLNLLSTKIGAPACRQRIVPFTRVRNVMLAGLERKLTLVVSTAGAGKTTLLCDFVRWASKSGWRTAWLSLDSADNDPTRFWRYVMLALDQADPALDLSSLIPPDRTPGPDICANLEPFLGRIAEVGHDLYLVIDDYHLIQTERIHTAVAYLITRMPANMHLAIASRLTPPIPLSRLRAQDQMVEVRAHDLRFTLADTVDFLRRVMGLEVSIEDASTIAELTQGWVAALQLATLWMQGRGDVRGVIKEFSGSSRFMLEFLTEEVLGQQNEPTREFLLLTSVLDRMTASLCDAVTGREDSQQVLEYLVDSDLLITPLDENGEWFRYHALFSQALKYHLKRSHSEKQISAIYLAASGWADRNCLPEPAIEYALLGGDTRLAVRTITKYLFDVLKRNEGEKLLKWLGRLPDTQQHGLEYYVANAWANFISGKPEQSRRWVELARSYPAQDSDATKSLAGFEHILRTIEACSTSLAGDYPNGVKLSLAALEHLDANELWLRTTLLHNLGESYERLGDFAASANALQESRAIAPSAGRLPLVSLCTYELGWLQYIQGQLQQAASTYRQAITSSDTEETRRTWGVGLAYVGLGRVHLIRNDLDVAEELITQGGEMLSGGSNLDGYLESRVALAELKVSRCDCQAAREILAAAGAFAAQSPIPRGVGFLLALSRAEILLACGEVSPAEQITASVEAELPEEDLYYRLRCQALRADLSLANGRPGDALALLEAALPQALSAGLVLGAVRMLVAEGRSLAHLDRTEEAVDAVLRAVRMSQAEGYVLPFLRPDPALNSLLYKGLAKSKASHSTMSFIRSLLVARQERWPSAAAIEDEPEAELSSRERQVLDLLRTGMSRREISEHLGLSLNTVKTHTRNIYDKLGIHERGDLGGC